MTCSTTTIKSISTLSFRLISSVGSVFPSIGNIEFMQTLMSSGHWGLEILIFNPTVRGFVFFAVMFSSCGLVEMDLLCFLQYTVTEPRKRAYADFYKQYDAVKEFNAMREAGVFQSVRPSGEWSEEDLFIVLHSTKHQEIQPEALKRHPALHLHVCVSAPSCWSEDGFLSPRFMFHWSDVNINTPFVPLNKIHKKWRSVWPFLWVFTLTFLFWLKTIKLNQVGMVSQLLYIYHSCWFLPPSPQRYTCAVFVKSVTLFGIVSCFRFIK